MKKKDACIPTKPLDQQRMCFVLEKLKTISADFSFEVSDSVMDNGYTLEANVALIMMSRKKFRLTLSIKEKTIYLQPIKEDFLQIWQLLITAHLVDPECIKQWNQHYSPLGGGISNYQISQALLSNTRALAKTHNLHVVDTGPDPS